MEKIKFEISGNQIIVPNSEWEKLKAMNKELQNKFRVQGLYKDFDNRAEEKIGEYFAYDFLSRELPEWDIDPTFMDVSRFDISLKHRAKPYALNIEVKTKPEAPKNYILKHEHPNWVDKGPAVPEDKVNQVLDADYTLWFVASKFSSCSSYLANSTELTGITRRKDLTKNSFKSFPPAKKGQPPYVALPIDPERSAFAFTGIDGMKALVREIKKMSA